MPRVQVQRIGEAAALPLSAEMMELLGVHFGDEVDVMVENHKLIVSLPNEEERKKKIAKAVCEVFERRASVYQRLAEGVGEK